MASVGGDMARNNRDDFEVGARDHNDNYFNDFGDDFVAVHVVVPNCPYQKLHAGF
jgi:hypothetical protein